MGNCPECSCLLLETGLYVSDDTEDLYLYCPHCDWNGYQTREIITKNAYLDWKLCRYVDEIEHEVENDQN